MEFLGGPVRVRMELVAGLLIMLGMILGGSEGIKCYVGKGSGPGEPMDCSAGITGCEKSIKDNAVIGRDCAVDKMTKECVDKVFGADGGCYKKGEKEAEYGACIDPPPPANISGRTPSKGKQGPVDTNRDKACYCFTDLCNSDTPTSPAGRSTPNKQVIFAFLVPAVLYIFNLGVLLGVSPCDGSR